MRAILIIAGLGLITFGATILAVAVQGGQLTQGGEVAAGTVIAAGGLLCLVLFAGRTGEPPRDNGKRR